RLRALLVVAQHADEHASVTEIGTRVDGRDRHEADARVLQLGRDCLTQDLTHRFVDSANPVFGHCEGIGGLTSVRGTARLYSRISAVPGGFLSQEKRCASALSPRDRRTKAASARSS